MAVTAEHNMGLKSLSVSGYVSMETSPYARRRENVKSFLSHKAHRAALISVSLALSQTPVYTARPRIRG